MQDIDTLDTVIRTRGNSVIAAVPQALLYAKADTVEKALSLLEDKKRFIKAGMDDAGEFDDLTLQTAAVDGRQRRGGGGDLASFAMRFCLGLVIAVVVLSLSAFILVRSVGGLKIGGDHFWAKVEKEIHRAAQPGTPLSEEKKQKILADLRAIAQKWRPLLLEVQAALSDPAETAAPKQ